MSLNILVVEDSLIQAKTIHTTLENEGYTVFLSSDGSGILGTIIDKKIDILLLDIVLPGLDGFELLSQVLSCNETSDTPTIMVTGLTSGYDVKRAMDLGAFDYLKKPIDPLELIARVNSAVRLKQKQDMLKDFAVKDKLTGLYNRLYFDDILTQLVEDIGAIDKGISIAMIDCDYFKRINDTFGHVPGDKVLEMVANVLIKSTKNTDIVCRYGGEEFCIILMKTSLHQAFFISERIRKNVEKIRLNFGKKECGVTISIGVAHLSQDEKMTSLELVDKADHALYRAKSLGRNRVEIANGDSDL